MKSKPDYKKTASEYALEKRLEAMKHKDLIKYHKRRVNIWATIVLILVITMYAGGIIGLYNHVDRIGEVRMEKIERTNFMARYICSDINESYYKYEIALNNDNIKISCEHTTILLVK